MNDILELFNNYNIDSGFAFFVEIISAIIKIIFLAQLIKNKKNASIPDKVFFLINLIIVGEILSDVAWIARLQEIFFSPVYNFRISTFVIRIAWSLCFIEYYSLSLFISYLTHRSVNMRAFQKILSIPAILFGCYYFVLAFTDFFINSNEQRSFIELISMKFFFIFMFITIVPSIIYAKQKIKSKTLPRILEKQLSIFINYLIIPKLIIELISANPLSTFFPFFEPVIAEGNYWSVALSTLITTYALYFCARKMMGLRFLNVHKHVQSQEKFNFIDDFKQTLESLSHVTNVQELKHITQHFFKEAFNLPAHTVNLIMRPLEASHNQLDKRAIYIENSLAQHDAHLLEYLREQKIIITDEIEFTHFYESTPQITNVISWLTKLDCDLFLPIIERNTISAYIIIDRHAREAFYSSIERDEMLVFASYLSNLIYLLRNRNLDALLEQERTLKEELYHKHQEINQYKESIRSFLRTREHKIGIIFYKYRKFIFGNQSAQELLGINPQDSPGHPLTLSLKKLVQNAQQFKTVQTITTKNNAGVRLVLTALYSLENDLIIMAYYPELSDLMKDKLDILKDPSDWDYVLYLETTASGQLINTIIPGSGETLLQFKIDLLKLALSKKALFIHMAPEDLLPMVEIIHHISMRSQLHTLKLTAPEKNHEIAIKLFGLNPLFQSQQPQEALLETASETGTIYIENIHFLSEETQHELAHYLQYGYFRIFKSDRTLKSNVRIIASSNQDLESCVQKGTFSSHLLHYMRAATLNMPSLLTLQEEEFLTLAEGFVQQAVASDALRPMLVLQEKDKQHLVKHRPVSLSEFKKIIHHTLTQKSLKKNISGETLFDPAFHVSDPELLTIARLGKRALKDQKIMNFLWNKFQNQTKIATLLGVNRSSVNRRCKQFNLID